MTKRKVGTLLVGVLTIMLCAAQAHAETVNCTAITSLPAVITIQGIYCFTGDLPTNVSSGNAIEVKTNNVVIDMNGHKLGGVDGGPTTLANGIAADSHKNITIRNGTIRGFYAGIGITDIGAPSTSSGHIIENVRADANTATGIYLVGAGSIIRNNVVVNTSGSTTATNVTSVGISMSGSGVRVLNNDVVDTRGRGTGGSIDVYVAIAPGAVVKKNRLTHTTRDPGGATGIAVTGSPDVSILQNRLSNVTTGVSFDGGSTGNYRGNITNSVDTPYTGGTDGGNNN